MSDTRMKVSVTRELVVPMVPNFVKLGDEMVSIGQLTDAHLKMVAREWGRALLKRAEAVRRANAKPNEVTK